MGRKKEKKGERKIKRKEKNGRKDSPRLRLQLHREQRRRNLLHRQRQQHPRRLRWRSTTPSLSSPGRTERRRRTLEAPTIVQQMKRPLWNLIEGTRRIE